MAEQSRSLRKFIMDPKSSVMTYIADNIDPDRLSHHQGNANSLSGQQAHTHDLNQSQQSLGQSHTNQSQNSSGYPQDSSYFNSAVSQPSQPPTSTQPAQTSQMALGRPYLASNLTQPTSAISADNSTKPTDAPPWRITDQQIPQSQAQNTFGQSQVPSIGGIGQGSPPPGARRNKFPQSAPRQFNRLVLEFERMKNAFFVAESQHRAQEIASAASALEVQAHKIWGLRIEHAREFEGYSESAHQSIVCGWQAQYELWADTVLDIQEGHFNPSDSQPPVNSISPMDGVTQAWNPHTRQDNQGSNNLPGSELLPAQQVPQFQNLSLGQGMAPQPSMEDFQAQEQSLPGTFPQSTMPTGGPTNPSKLPDQRQQYPQQQLPMPISQNEAPGTRPGMQTGQPTQPGPLSSQQSQAMTPAHSPNQHGQAMPQGVGGYYQQGQSPNQQGQTIPQGVGEYSPQGQNTQSGLGLSMQQGTGAYSQHGQNAPSRLGPNAQQGQSIVPGTGAYQQGPNMAPGGGPNMQQKMRPGGTSNVQQRPNMAHGSAPNMQQPQTMSQGPPGPARNPTPSGPNPPPYSSPRPQMPPNLQAGSPGQGGGRP